MIITFSAIHTELNVPTSFFPLRNKVIILSQCPDTDICNINVKSDKGLIKTALKIHDALFLESQSVISMYNSADNPALGCWYYMKPKHKSDEFG